MMDAKDTNSIRYCPPVTYYFAFGIPIAIAYSHDFDMPFLLWIIILYFIWLLLCGMKTTVLINEDGIRIAPLVAIRQWGVIYREWTSLNVNADDLRRACIFSDADGVVCRLNATTIGQWSRFLENVQRHHSESRIREQMKANGKN